MRRSSPRSNVTAPNGGAEGIAARDAAADGPAIERRLADAIYEHRLPPGTRLVEADLCRFFNVTRGAVRKVLGRLATEQLIDLVPNRGAFVARPTVAETRDIFELRRIVEGGVVRRVAGRADREWCDRVRRQVAEEREARRTGDTPAYIRLAGQFHLDLAAATGNAALVQHLKRLVAQTSLMLALYDVPGINTCSFHEHLEILDAIEADDRGKAERLMEDHLLGCERQLRLDDDPQPISLAQALGVPSTRAARVRPAARTKRSAPPAGAAGKRSTARTKPSAS